MVFLLLVLSVFGSFLLSLCSNTTDFSPPQNLRDYLLKQQRFFDVLMNPTAVVQDGRAMLANVLYRGTSDVEDVTFDLYTKSNPAEAFPLILGDAESLIDSPFSSERPTKVVIHGWMESGNVIWMHNIRRNYLSVGDYNVICLNWFPGSAKEYMVSTRLSRQVASRLINLLEFLKLKADLSLDDVHILGHSLGAHIAGFAGEGTLGEIGRVTGLDPARPAFESPYLKNQKDRLDSSDAKFVDVVHTCAGTLGFIGAIGHVDFYPNGGSFIQPGCSVFSSQSCSHERSHQFMAESILHPQSFVAVQCDSWTYFKAGYCNSNPRALMGEKVNFDLRGTFFLMTNPQSLFGKGEI